MTLLVTLLNASAPVRRAAALTLLALGAFMLSAIVWIAGISLSSAAADIVSRRERLGQLQSVAILADRLAPVMDETSTTEASYLLAGSDAAIRSTLQKRLDTAASANAAAVVFSDSAEPLAIGDVGYSGIRANLSGSIDSIERTLFALESALPVLFVKQIAIRSTGSGIMPSDGQEPDLFAEIVFYGARQALAETGKAQ